MKRCRIMAVSLCAARILPNVGSRDAQVFAGSIRTRSTQMSREQRAVPLMPRGLSQPMLDQLADALGHEKPTAVSVLRQRAKMPGARGRRESAVAGAIFHLVADLLDQGWDVSIHRDRVFIMPPDATPVAGESVEQVKSRLRASLQSRRDAQLSDPAVRSFIRRMERPVEFSGRKVSVLNLIDDGHDLASQLRDVALLPPSERPAALRRVVSPAIEVATADTMCRHTGLPLLDIWRYFRHSWSLEYRPTPGRTLFLILRNCARPFAPVMGIAALANAVPQLGVRDRWVGWTTAKLTEQLESRPEEWPSLREALLRTLRDAKASIRVDDLLIEVGEAAGPELERRLLSIAREAEVLRARELKRRQARLDSGEALESLRRLPTDAEGATDWRTASEAPLYRRKRASTLADILMAERVIRDTSIDGTVIARSLTASEELRRAVSRAMREVRKVGLASRLLELNVCGAIPPYNELLVGKLVALSIASREVSEWYQERYRCQVSEIASQMAGREVVRTPVICAVSTTSLYGVAASQYNRLRVDVEDGTSRGNLNWQDLGLSEGFGTAHLSRETLAALRKVSIETVGNRSVNNVFGEGTSPRLRQVREALAHLGIDPSCILKHRSQRRVYGLELFPGGLRALRMNDVATPTLFPFHAIVSAWRDRWLLPRLAKKEILERIFAFRPSHLSTKLHVSSREQLALFRDESPSHRNMPTMTRDSAIRSGTTTTQPQADLVQALYRATGAVADHHDQATVELLHIPTAADAFVLEQARAGKIVFVTGNPGDGKTHLLRRHEKELEAAGVRVCLDANEQTEEDLCSLVEYSLGSSHGTAIAINQGILLDLLRHARARPWSKEVSDQLLSPYEYISLAESTERTGGADSERGRDMVADERMLVVDLTLRNNLGPSVVERALAKILTLSAGCPLCSEGSCPGVFNVERLKQPDISKQVVRLLDQVARTGVHATMRDLQAFMSFLVFGGRRCDQEAGHMTPLPYWTNAFNDGVGPLFDAVRKFDPIRQPSPLLDDLLWRNADQDRDWLVAYDEPRATAEPLSTRLVSFTSRKRRALFEHREAGRLFEVAGEPMDRLFAELSSGRGNRVRTLVRMLNRFFDKDEERDDALFLWVTHRYDARASRYAAFAVSVLASSLEIAVPTLPHRIARAFPDYRPDHVLLRFKGNTGSKALRFDRDFISALKAADEGLPSTFRRGEPESRIAGFYDHLAKSAWGDAVAESMMKVRFVDIDTGSNLGLTVDIARCDYQRD